MRAFFVAFALALLAPLAHAQQAGPNPNNPVPQADPAAVRAAQEGLRTFAKLVTDANFQRLGFASVDEVRTATLGTPFDDVLIPLDRLRAYVPGQPVKDLFVKGRRVVFPVLVSGQPRSAITVAARPDGSYRPVSFGAPSFLQTFDKARVAASSSENLPPARFFIVRVPALNLHFLGRTEPSDATGLVFTLVQADPRLDLPVGRPIPASAVLSQLVPRAQAVRDDAPG